MAAYRECSIEDWIEMSRDKEFNRNVSHLDEIEKHLTIVGLFGLVDPLRKGINSAVLKCKSAGINVRMCTGDNKATAEAISREAGIINEQDLEKKSPYLSMTGEDFRNTVGGLIEV